MFIPTNVYGAPSSINRSPLRDTKPGAAAPDVAATGRTPDPASAMVVVGGIAIGGIVVGGIVVGGIAAAGVVVVAPADAATGACSSDGGCDAVATASAPAGCEAEVGVTSSLDAGAVAVAGSGIAVCVVAVSAEFTPVTEGNDAVANATATSDVG